MIRVFPAQSAAKGFLLPMITEESNKYWIYTHLNSITIPQNNRESWLKMGTSHTFMGVSVTIVLY